jgi:hypothetical protein
VLLAEATIPSKENPWCTLSGGQWYSYYDNAIHTNTDALAIDHVVPLAEAWESGASRWTTAQRIAYANDLRDNRSLVAVSNSVHQAKGDQDPAEWLPPYEGARCRYIEEWIAVKVRWGLIVDSAEKTALTRQAAACPDSTIRFDRAT